MFRASATVGTSGAAPERFSVVTAIGRNLPLFTNPIAAGMDTNSNGTWPPRTSVVAGPPPLYGMCSSLTPARRFSSSPAMCEGVPAPTEA